MTVRDALGLGRKLLETHGVESPYLDAVLILAHTLSVSKEKLIASYPDEVPEAAYRTFQDLITRRLAGTPVSYITGKKEFYGLTFHVDERVLVPRPDTEVLVERVIELLDGNGSIRKIHDVCTGSGCIPITLKRERPHLEVSASDISEAALEVCALNSRRILGTELHTRRSDLLREVPGRFDLITANPPYIPTADTRSMLDSGWPEPERALDGGHDGLDLVRRLAREALDSLSQAGYLIVEIAYNQADAATGIMTRSGYSDITIIRDLGGRNRAVLCRKGA